MARTAEPNATDAESALALVSQGKGFSDVVTAQMSQWGCSRSSAQRDCRWAHDQLQLSIDSHDAQHLVCHKGQAFNASLKAEQDKQYAAAVGAQKMLYELLLRRKMDNEAEKARRPGWGYSQRHGNTSARQWVNGARNRDSALFVLRTGTVPGYSGLFQAPLNIYFLATKSLNNIK